ncbi:DUF2080 family transposase-associated protein [Salinibaculum rarum]|uniref:DUF2080 family transposase-associated protein n=1 Tax=Salinibaculum rarum TaxID=3058903 RepID=UPI00265DAB37|nr:DUF2080 family transposase-associated protein [Salinibaculum sp. KK48]
MANQREQDEHSEFEKEVKEFGNGAHVTLPGEYVGETVIVKPVADEKPTLHPPITKGKIKSTLTDATREDFTFRTREDDNFPREGEYQYDSDLRLSIDVELVWEGDGHQIIEEETGRVVHQLHDATSGELVEHTDWWTEEDAQRVVGKKEDGSDITASPEPVLLCIDPAVSDLFDHAGVGYGDAYRYSVKWNDSEIVSVMFCNRMAKNGRFYVPFWENYESLEQYQSSISYALATAISKTPSEEYDQYLEVMTKRGIGWNGDADPAATRNLSHHEKLEETIVCRP